MSWFNRKETGLPDTLATLGFEAHVINGVEVILPPLCDVPAGTFLMGSNPRKDRDADSDEEPQHSITLAAFQIAKFPLTVAEYDCFIQSGHAEPEPSLLGDTEYMNWYGQRVFGDHPAINIPWRDVVAYAVWLAQLTGQSWHLPTEAEWEKAARGTDGRIYPWGDIFDQARVHTRVGPGWTIPVGSHPNGASPYGAHDMVGNVLEWTSSLFKPYPYSASDGREDLNATGPRAQRGSYYRHDSRGMRAANRSSILPVNGYGARLARSVPGA